MVLCVLLGAFCLVFYVTIWRLQNKRSQAHQELVSGLMEGDEVITTGGVVGEVAKVGDSLITLKVSNNTLIQVQKVAVAATLPKGTLNFSDT